MSLCFLVYRTACTRSQQTSLPPCLPSSFHLQVRHRTHRYRQKQNFLPKPRFQFRKMSYCCRSNCQRHGVLFAAGCKKDSSSLLLLSVEISGAPKKLSSSDWRYWRTSSSAPTMTLAAQLDRRACLRRLRVCTADTVALDMTPILFYSRASWEHNR